MKSSRKRHSNIKSIFSPEMNTPEDLTRVYKLYMSCAMIRRKHHLLNLTGHGMCLSDEVRDRDRPYQRLPMPIGRHSCSYSELRQICYC